jgi:hypothetical protein
VAASSSQFKSNDAADPPSKKVVDDGNKGAFNWVYPALRPDGRLEVDGVLSGRSEMPYRGGLPKHHHGKVNNLPVATLT